MIRKVLFFQATNGMFSSRRQSGAERNTVTGGATSISADRCEALEFKCDRVPLRRFASCGALWYHFSHERHAERRATPNPLRRIGLRPDAQKERLVY